MLSPSKRGESSLSASTAITESSLPLRIALGTLLIKVFPLHPDGHAYSEEDAIYSHIFTSTILRIVAREILELATPATYISLLRETDPLIKTEIKRLDHRIERKRQRGEHYDHLDPFLEFESWLGPFSSTFSDPCDGCEYIRRMSSRSPFLKPSLLNVIPKPIEHQSVIGIFIRDLLLTLRKMSFEESITLSRLMGIWCGANVPSITRPLHIYSLNRKTAMEDTFRKRQDALQKYTSASASGDHTKALHALRQFYDYQFPANLRGQHQHALLGLATFHYSTRGVEVARTAVNESIRVARAEGDKQCLQKCLSLLRRLDLEASPVSSGGSEGLRISQAPLPASKLSPATSANDELWSIKPALDLGEPIHVALGRVHRALGRYETSIAPSEESKELVPPDELDMAAWHSTQAALWSSLGSNTLCNLHMNMASRHASNPTARLTVALSKAERVSMPFPSRLPPPLQHCLFTCQNPFEWFSSET
ncbi:hypothetical protein TREMEDRAFT_31441 [Tremella mesenterica DSM 1558]|uniref:uncharacterized protein n=1 Tax=Tremella mesenterica (strain ATCC 24925 / CBS 8224 / DSM 1558 / NBRC 9311 / NRRL Y-6157 / RJB 2259-6 / UBC 559-6) TaxID=578456 RepID=UPI0003F48F92|nr:uncharacterized protein TREMEDRAFT_31441 [Tremella mesenterica DSM 1558]EIW68894.1 hypothetical protein TREMEDRAFT_31441 [Tremella mesenterica DSM 1558]